MALDGGGRGVDLRLPSRAGDDVGSGVREAVDQRPPDPGGATEDDRDASREVESLVGHRRVLAKEVERLRCQRADFGFGRSESWMPAMIAGPTPLGSFSTTRSLM